MKHNPTPPAARAARQRVLEAAIRDMHNRFVGYTDLGDNSGKMAGYYLYGEQKLAWCAAAATTWLIEAIPNLNFGRKEWLSYNLVQRAQSLGCWHDAGDGYTPKPGDVGIFLNIEDLAGSPDWVRGHTGIIESFEPASRTAHLVSANITAAITDGQELDSISRESYSETDIRRGEQKLAGYIDVARLAEIYQARGEGRHTTRAKTSKSALPNAVSL